jgi:hypothetical protein
LALYLYAPPEMVEKAHQHYYQKKPQQQRGGFMQGLLGVLTQQGYKPKQAGVSTTDPYTMSSRDATRLTGYAQQPLKRIPIKGLYKTLLSFEEFVALVEHQARTSQRRLLQARRRASTDAARHGTSPFPSTPPPLRLVVSFVCCFVPSTSCF